MFNYNNVNKNDSKNSTFMSNNINNYDHNDNYYKREFNSVSSQ